jgi:L-fucose isomerase-like protein
MPVVHWQTELIGHSHVAMNRIRIAIAVDDDALERLEEVAGACRALGFLGDTTLAGVGVLTGSIEVNRVEALRAIPGVAVVELERHLRVHTLPRRSM